MQKLERFFNVLNKPPEWFVLLFWFYPIVWFIIAILTSALLELVVPKRAIGYYLLVNVPLSLDVRLPGG